ncbi:CBU_0592 family membrane protein [Novosphingopyxis sp. YJ-S2-01]|uniref:CBU_0592 family membrane protein n=1 Tax=Novosphingopyxis sp. YJ-S2-01 TaxID=2794021 RepID=UPI0018DD26BC|nr:permease [Novosphingopyxis sp. YJ-S2-01]MBH9538617.1 permease [Novosphingopyxis sp. YJ-S2-01]
MALDIYTVIGFVGMACIVAAYAYLTWQKNPNPWVLHGTNLAGAVLLAISLVVHTNWPSLILEGFWGAIAIYGLIKATRNRASAQGEEQAV